MDFLEKISSSVEKGQGTEVKSLISQGLEQGIPEQVMLGQGLFAGMNIMEERFQKKEIFLTELLLSSFALKEGLSLFTSLQRKEPWEKRGKVIIGTVQGDHHDIGKNMVKTMMECKGIQVIDLGTDVPADAYVQALRENHDCHMIACSTHLTSCLPSMEKVVLALENAGLRENVKIMIGGNPVTEAFCKEIGADTYTPDASTAAEIAARLCPC
ncbi:MAG: cobalamin-dependent protein [Eubacteriales bacterium]